LVSVSAERHWEQKMALPTGVVKPVAESIDPRRPRTIGSLPSEHYPGMGMMHNLLYSAFGRARGLPSDADGGIGCTIRDAAQSVEVRMECSASFGALVLFTPPWNSSLSLEPHTCVPDAFNLANQGLETGMVVLSPGGTWRGWVRMSAREL
ncbi:MAG: hypothetical protein HYY04_04595, partial [Chloroflexi bacterium]|nr:hypothetical protein [Chloroflexota bacterium]